MASPLNNANILSSVLLATVPKPHLRAVGTGGGLNTYMQSHTHTHRLRRIACETLVLRANAGLIRCSRAVSANQKPVNEETQLTRTTKCFCVCGSANTTQVELTLHPKSAETGFGGEVQNRRRILAQKCCRGSDTPGMVKS